MGNKPRKMRKPEKRQEWIYDILISNETGTRYIDVWETYQEKYKLSQVTFDKDWKKAKDRFDSLLDTVVDKKEKEIVKQEMIAFKEGLKSKYDRQMNLQRQADQCLQDLASGMTSDVYIEKETGVVVEFERKMNIREINQTRKTLKDVQAEISKISGDYAPTKTEEVGNKDRVLNVLSLKVLESGNKPL